MKRFLTLTLACVLMVTALAGCSGKKVYPMGKAAEVKTFNFWDEENKCDYCGASPVCVFHNPDDPEDKNNAYICEKCASECLLCGKKATHYYQNGASSVVFVCQECYNEAVKNGMLQ